MNLCDMDKYFHLYKTLVQLQIEIFAINFFNFNFSIEYLMIFSATTFVVSTVTSDSVKIFTILPKEKSISI